MKMIYCILFLTGLSVLLWLLPKEDGKRTDVKSTSSVVILISGIGTLLVLRKKA
ncbi:MAG: hypothetical protein ACOVRB_04140 [Akkermansiaceae bacterium]|jgi:hypothetical protein